MDKSKWVFWDPENEALPEYPSRDYKISICTTCMGRVADLKATLPVNIMNNIDYPKVEFVILSYGKDDELDGWIREACGPCIEKGVVRYVQMIDPIPTHYSMSKSRNIAFKAATGDMVNSVDADNFVNRGFAAHINRMGHVQPARGIFAKGIRLTRGRLGFWKKDFLELGGYDEELEGYGHDDKDLLYRALCSQYKMFWYGGQFVTRLRTSRAQKVQNMQNKDWKATENANRDLSAKNIEEGKLVANQGKPWGNARVLINFEQEASL